MTCTPIIPYPTRVVWCGLLIWHPDHESWVITINNEPGCITPYNHQRTWFLNTTEGQGNNGYPLVQARDPWGLIIDPKTLVWNEVPQTLSVVPQDWFRPWGLAVAWWSRMKVPPSHIMSEQHVRQKLQIFPRTCMVPQCFVRLYSFLLSSLPSLFQFSSSMSENGIWRRQT